MNKRKNEEQKILGQVEINLSMEFKDSNTANIIEKSIEQELLHQPTNRAQITWKLHNNQLNLHVLARDLTSARATINSILKWINVSLEIHELTKVLG